MCKENGEFNSQFTGEQGYVHRYFVLIGALLQVTLVSVPIAMALVSFLRPCMPPVVLSFTSFCTSWEDDGGAGPLFKISLALLEGYTWAAASGVISFALYIGLMYPTEILLLVISKLERWVKKYCKLLNARNICSG